MAQTKAEKRQKTREYMRRLSEERHAAGLCISCGKRTPKQGKKTCSQCLEYFRGKSTKNSRRRREARKAAGLCTSCGERPPADGRVTCSQCREEEAKRRDPIHTRNVAAARQERFKAAGLCSRCGKRPPKPGLITCQECLDKIAGFRERWAEQGLCNRCGKYPHLPDRPICQECSDKHHASYLKSREEGRHKYYYRKAHNLCQGCGKPLEISDESQKPRATCDECRAKRRLENAKKRNWRYPEIVERDGCCQICGRTGHLCVHHIDGRGQSHNGKLLPPSERNDDPANLITLCRYCHHAITILRRQAADRQVAVRLVLA